MIDLFRVENGQLAEHWDAMQLHPQETVSGRRMTDGAVAIQDLDKTVANKALVKQYYETTWIGGDWAALGDFVHPELAQHNPGLEDCLPALAASAKGDVENTKVHRLIAEGNFVVGQLAGFIDGLPHVIYEIHRLADGMIVEQWQAKQAIPEQMVHQNGML